MATYTPNYSIGNPINPNTAQNTALGAATSTLNNIGTQAYTVPQYYGGDKMAPANQPYYQTQAVPSLEKMNLPSYLSFQNNDFNSWEDAIKNAAQGDINAQMGRTQANMQNILGGGGLYGSSIQGDQMTNLGDAWARALGSAAANAKTQRMQMEQDALNAQNTWNLNRTGLGMDQNKSVWQSNAAEQARMDQYNQGKMNWTTAMDQSQRDFINSQAQNWQNYQNGVLDWRQAIDDAIFNKQMALATGSMPAASSQLSALTNLDRTNAYQDQADSQNTQALWNAIGGTLGGYLTLADSQNSWNPFEWF